MISSLKKDCNIGSNCLSCLLKGLEYCCHEAWLDANLRLVLVLDICIVHIEHHDLNLSLSYWGCRVEHRLVRARTFSCIACRKFQICLPFARKALVRPISSTGSAGRITICAKDFILSIGCLVEVYLREFVMITCSFARGVGPIENIAIVA